MDIFIPIRIPTGPVESAGTLDDGAMFYDTVNDKFYVGWAQAKHEVGGSASSGIEIVSTADPVAQTGTVADLFAYSTPAADGTFSVSLYILVTANMLSGLTVALAFTDTTNVAKSITLTPLNGLSLSGGATGAFTYESGPVRAKASTALTLSITFSGTSISYLPSGRILKL